MPDPIVITVCGQPAPQGSKRAFVAGGRAHVIESSHDRVKSWRRAVVDAASLVKAWPALTGPLHLEMVFYLRRPKSHYRTGRNAHLLRESAPAYPGKTPDLSKLARATEDALSDAMIWADDAQVVTYAPLAKRWAGGPGAPEGPGASIRITQIGDDHA